MDLSFGQALHQIRTSKCLSLRQLSALTGINYSTLSKLERGERHPTPQMISLFSKHLSADEDLLTRHWLSDVICSILKEQKDFENILKSAGSKLKHGR